MDSMERLRAAYERASLPYSPWKGKSFLTTEEIGKWEEAQARLPPTVLGYADISCLLAFFGVNYPANLARLLAPYVALRGNAVLDQAAQEKASDLRCLPDHLVLLYHRWGDAQTLDCLLDLEVQGTEAQAAYQEALALLWDEHQVAILRAAAASPSRLDRIASALGSVCRRVGEPLMWAAYARQLRLARYSRESAVMEAAQVILAQLKRLQPGERREGFSAARKRECGARLNEK